MYLPRLIPLFVFSSLLVATGCKKKQEETKAPSPEQPITAAQPPAEDPELQPIQSLNPTTKGQFSLGANAQAPATDGRYSIQVDIKPSRHAAQKVVDKLQGAGIPAYIAEVENPGELEGTYYRVRVGFFATVSEATQYAKSVLAPQGYAWWVDNRANDHVGNPSSAQDESSYQSPPSSSDWNSAPATTPPPQPTSTPAAKDSDWNAAPAQPVTTPPPPAAQTQPPTDPPATPPAPTTPAAVEDDWQ